VFLFLGGFCLARAMERWNLHERIALYVLRAVGTRPDRVIGGFMAATAGLSMWVSNTATATMMLPIAATVASLAERSDDDTDTFHVGLLLAVAFGANIGGLGTLIGTPPNALFAGYLRESHGVDVGFAQWMLLGVPVAAVLLAVGWAVLTRLYCPPRQPARQAPGGAGPDTGLGARLAALGPMTRGERLVLVVFLATAALWIARPFLGDLLGGRLSDAGIGVLAALVLFAVPVQPTRRSFLLDWSDTARLPWGVLILVGGGLSLGAAVASSGLSDWIAGRLDALAALPVWAAVAAFAAVVMAISHITSNTATAATFLPLAGSFAAAAAVAPALICAPVVLAAGCAFMLPVATPPNAIVFATGRMTVADMLRAGALVNLLALGLLTAAAATLVPLVFA
jgi:sodium-dependent dicarboxylate transporter 2/3/5